MSEIVEPVLETARDMFHSYIGWQTLKRHHVDRAESFVALQSSLRTLHHFGYAQHTDLAGRNLVKLVEPVLEAHPVPDIDPNRVPSKEDVETSQSWSDKASLALYERLMAEQI